MEIWRTFKIICSIDFFSTCLWWCKRDVVSVSTAATPQTAKERRALNLKRIFWKLLFHFRVKKQIEFRADKNKFKFPTMILPKIHISWRTRKFCLGKIKIIFRQHHRERFCYCCLFVCQIDLGLRLVERN